MQGSIPRAITNVFSLSSDNTCLNLAGILTRPFESSEYAYSPVNVLFVKVMFIRGNYPQLPIILPNRQNNVNKYSKIIFKKRNLSS